MLALLGRLSALAARAIREQVPLLNVKVSSPSSERWGAPFDVAPRVLTWLGARAEIVRGRNAGHGALAPSGRPCPPGSASHGRAWPEPEGYAELVRRWLARFGPGTEADLAWWLGSTKAAVRRALGDLEAVEVRSTAVCAGWLLPDDLEPEADVAPSAALLPVLDPTTMGWRSATSTSIRRTSPTTSTRPATAARPVVEGRIVGCWVQADDGRVEVVLRRDPGAADGRRSTPRPTG